MVRLKVRPKVLIGRDGRCSVCSLSKGIWLDETEDGPSEVRPKYLIGRDGRWSVWSLSEVSDWTKRNLVCMMMRPTCMSCQSDLIGRDGIWSYLLKTLLVGWFDGSVFWKRFWLADPMDLSSGVFFWLIFTPHFAVSYSHLRLTRNNTRNASSFCDEYAVQYAVARKTYKMTITSVITYSTRGGVLKLCTMLEDVAP